MKTCTRCGSEKEESEFRWKNKNLEIRQTACKLCARSEGKNHYRNNRKTIINKVVARHKENRRGFYMWKNTLRCVICPEDDASCLDFHHVNSDSKEHTISELISNSQISKARRELEKCVIICSNCHRKHHAGRLTLTGDHIKVSKKLFETIASVSPLASNQ